MVPSRSVIIMHDRRARRDSMDLGVLGPTPFKAPKMNIQKIEQRIEVELP